MNHFFDILVSYSFLSQTRVDFSIFKFVFTLVTLHVANMVFNFDLTTPVVASFSILSFSCQSFCINNPDSAVLLQLLLLFRIRFRSPLVNLAAVSLSNLFHLATAVAVPFLNL